MRMGEALHNRSSWAYTAIGLFVAVVGGLAVLAIWEVVHPTRQQPHPTIINNVQPVITNNVQPSPVDEARVPTQGQPGVAELARGRVPVRSLGAGFECTFILYNGAEIPHFYVDGREILPTSYNNGLATLRLAAGSHTIKAVYPSSSRECSAIFTAPSEGQPIITQCGLK
jgi:hypothetical protein